MSVAASTSYDELPYGSNVFSYAHPDRLATLASLLGMTPAPLEQCRVLELGCGPGTNLIAMATDLPDCRFVGIDLSARQIAMGQETQRALGVANVELQAKSILDVDEGLGQFDYILCHGVFSWVPPPVQDKILIICARNLAPAGVAYVSYNTYPGWHMRGMVREMMRFHVAQFDDPLTRVQQARALLDFLIETTGDASGAYGKLLAREASMLEGTPDTYVYHEHLEEVNHPLYFHQFAQQLGAKGLQYMAEARPIPLPTNLSPKTQETLREVSVDLIHAEQYLDFIRNSTFRRSLICHDHVKLSRPPVPQAVLSMRITGLVKPKGPGADLAGGVPVEFRNPEGVQLTTHQPLLKAALIILADAFPRAVPFDELWRQVLSRLKEAHVDCPDADPLGLAGAFIQCFLADLAELHVYARPFVLVPGARPVASRLARLMAESTFKVANLRHHMVELSEFECQVLRRLDGNHDRDSLLRGLLEAVASGDLNVQKDNQTLTDLDQVRALLVPSLEPTLRRFGQNALLVE